MISQLAKDDLEDLRAEGLAPTDEDIIRLHALALRITNGPETTAATAPRFAVVGGVVFWELTLAARYWLNFACRFAKDDATDFWLFAFASANGRRRGYLSALQDPGEIERALGSFLGKISATRAEVENALNFVAYGHDDVKPEPTDMAKASKADEMPDDRKARNLQRMEKLLAEAAAATGLTFDDIMMQTTSRLRAMIYEANVLAGMELTRTSARANADYLATYNAIASRLRAEKAKGIG